MKLERVEIMNRRLHVFADAVGKLLVDAFHYIGLFAIGSAIVWAAAHAFAGMADRGHASIHDILLLFIYLELGAMVGIYFKTNHMPVRFLIYVAMTALTRLLIDDVQQHERPDMAVVIVSAAILLLAVAALIIRIGSSKFPSEPPDNRG